ncbi:hypothetical protein B0H11DRAFT_1994676 [Mycena galericulata]|nr:hypothetical protein B0H11DRAFT_1994676 [Mycena galericulata]
MDEIQVNSPRVEAGLVPMQGASAMFHSAHNFSISGGEFTHTVNFVNNFTRKTRKTSGLKDFRQIRLGDLDLREEKGLGRNVGSVRQNRRVYAARVHGCKRPVTVAVYEGADAEEVCGQGKWRYIIQLGRNGWKRSRSMRDSVYRPWSRCLGL